MDDLEMHKHNYGWHGYLLLDAEPSNTSYNLPPSKNKDGKLEQVLISLNNSNNVLVMLCGGIDHAVPIAHAFDGSRPRVSVAFDFIFSTRANGMIVSHPGMNGVDKNGVPQSGKVQRLDEDVNTWMELLPSDQLQHILNGNPAYAFNYDSLLARYKAAKRHPKKMRHTWGGLVQLAQLV